MAENMVKFRYGSAAEFAALQGAVDDNTIYFLTDSKNIYRGNVRYDGTNVEVVTSDSEITNKTDTLYVNATEHTAKYYDGQTLIPLGSKVATSITGASGDVVTDKLVFDFIKNGVAKDLAATNTTVATHTQEIANLKTATGTTLPQSIEQAKTELTQKIQDVSATVQTNTANIAKKADKATTLAGYGITDGMTATEIKAAIASAGHLKRQVLEGPLPEVGEENIIYLVPKPNKTMAAGVETQLYDEYIWVNGKFEKIGDTAVGMAGYATEEYVNNAVKDKITLAQAQAAAGELDTALETKITKAYQTYADGKAASAQANAEKAAAADATTKADAAKTQAIAAAKTDAAQQITEATPGILASAEKKASELATAAQTAAVNAAASDATTKAETAKAQAIGEAAKATTLKVNEAKTEIEKKLGTGVFSETNTVDAAIKAAATKGTNAQAAIDALNMDTKATANTYVSGVQQTKGLITTTTAQLPVYAVAEGTGNGTIKINGSTDVKVHGLGDAAYKAASFFAPQSNLDATNQKFGELGGKTVAEFVTTKTTAAQSAATNAAKTYTDNALTWGSIGGKTV